MRTERLKLFLELLDSPMMNNDGNRSMLAMLFTNEDFGINGIKARKDIPVSSVKADLAFTKPLEIYNYLTKRGMKDIVETVQKAKGFFDYKMRLGKLGTAVTYSHLLAITDFHMHPVDMVPNLDREVIKEGLGKLFDMTLPLLNMYRYKNTIQSKLNYEMPRRGWFSGDEQMAWYLCSSDLSWTRELFKGIKKSTYSFGMFPYYSLICVAEKLAENFFDYYTLGIAGITLGNYGESGDNVIVTNEELIILHMIFQIDSICYRDFLKYHREAGLLSDKFIEQFNIFITNVDTMNDRVNAIIERRFRCPMNYWMDS